MDGHCVNLRILLEADLADEPFRPGDRITATVTLLDYGSDYLYTKGIAGNAEAVGIPVRTKAGNGHSFSALRDLLTERLLLGVEGEDAGFYSALLFNARDILSDEAMLAFRRSGTSHLLALSGMHLTVLGMLLLRLLRLLRAPHPLRFFILLVFLVLYAAIAGFPLSLLRASLMLTVYELGRLLRLLSDSLTALFFSVAAILLASPGAALDVGLLLSFLATLGILVALELYPRKAARGKPIRRFAHIVGFSLLSGLFAILFTMLISALTFGHISLVALPANLLLSPLVDLALTLGPLLLLFPRLLGPFAARLSGWILEGIRFAGGIRGAYAPADHPIFMAVLILFSVYVAALLVHSLRSRRAVLIRILAATTVLGTVFLATYIPNECQNFVLIVREASHDYLVLREGRRTTVVANACTSSPARLLYHLEAQGINEIDTLILTHSSQNEPEMIRAISGELLLRTVILPEQHEDEEKRSACIEMANSLGIAVKTESGQRIEANGAAVKMLLVQDSAHEGIFLLIDTQTTRIAYASPSALAAVNAEARRAFVEKADLLYIGAHPKAKAREVPLVLPSECHLLSAYYDLLPDVLREKAEKIGPNGSFLMPIP